MYGLGFKKWRFGGIFPMLKGQHCLDDPCNAGGGLQVANVGLRRAQLERPTRLAPLSIDCRQSLHLYRVSQRRARSMGLHVVNIRGLSPCVLKRIPNNRLLRQPVRHRQPLSFPVMVDC